MVDHARMELALSEFAQMLLDEFVVADVLQRLCEHAVQVLPVFGAGVSLRAAGKLTVAWATGPNVPELEELQRSLGQGPCEDVIADGAPLQAHLPDDQQRWPLYVPEVMRLGVRSLAAMPLRARGWTWGALDVYSARDEPFSTEDIRAVEVLTDVATAYLLTARDRQGRQAAEDQLRVQALHDPLTGLPNRLLLADRLHHALAAVGRHPGSVGVLFVDLDRFKQVNDTYGHDIGDSLLVTVARRLEQQLRPTDTLSRLGGDEFVVLCEDLQRGGDDLELIGERLIEALSVPLALSGGEIPVGGSVGAALAGTEDTPERLLRDADTAMYVAKRNGGGRVVVSARRRDPRLTDEIRMEGELQRALECKELLVAFQPVVSLRGGASEGVEALLRWLHPRRGLLDAGEFLPLAERSGLIVPIGTWVLREVCAKVPELRPADFSDDWFVSVNISTHQLRDPAFVVQLQAILAETGADPADLVLEVTERALARRGGADLAVLGQLAALGCRVAIDDFGTSDSSWIYLTRLPAAILKIDKSLVERVGRGTKDDALIRATVSSAHELGLRVIAEGVETPSQHEMLVAAGCDAGQGYLYGRPSPGGSTLTRSASAEDQGDDRAVTTQS